MTPAAQFAQKREEAIALIRTHAPSRLQDSLIALLRPAIALSAIRADDAQIPLGASKFGGAPDVPAGFVWPMWNDKPLGFLAQINLGEVAAFDVEELLPKSGLLSFFWAEFSDENPADVIPKHMESWRVFHFTDSVLSAFSVPENSQGDYQMATAIVSCSIKLTVPVSTYLIGGQNFRDFPKDELKRWQAWQEASRYLHPDGKQHQMLGHPIQTQDDARHQAGALTKRGGRQDWHLLFQFDEDEDNLDSTWSDNLLCDDSGVLFFLIHKDDLIARDFSKVWFVADCY